MQPHTRRAIVAGLVGTLALTLTLAWGPTIGAPPLNLPLWDGTFFTLNLGLAVALGYFIHFAVGVALAIAYQKWFQHRLSGEGWLRGAVFGLIIWGALMLVGLPIFDVLDPLVENGLMSSPGLFAMGLGIAAPVMLLFAHLIYGSIVGAMTDLSHAPLSLARRRRA